MLHFQHQIILIKHLFVWNNLSFIPMPELSFKNIKIHFLFKSFQWLSTVPRIKFTLFPEASNTMHDLTLVFISNLICNHVFPIYCVPAIQTNFLLLEHAKLICASVCTLCSPDFSAPLSCLQITFRLILSFFFFSQLLPVSETLHICF